MILLYVMCTLALHQLLNISVSYVIINEHVIANVICTMNSLQIYYYYYVQDKIDTEKDQHLGQR